MPKLKLATENKLVTFTKRWCVQYTDTTPLITGSNVQKNNQTLLYKQVVNEPQLIIQTIYSNHSKVFLLPMNGMIMPSIGNFNRIPQTIVQSAHGHNPIVFVDVPKRRESFLMSKQTKRESMLIHYPRL